MAATNRVATSRQRLLTTEDLLAILREHGPASARAVARYLVAGGWDADATLATSDVADVDESLSALVAGGRCRRPAGPDGPYVPTCWGSS